MQSWVRDFKDSKLNDYPLQKLILNRIFNLFVSIIFLNKYNDYTNAFKIYKRGLLDIMPLISESFNIFRNTFEDNFSKL